MTSSRASAAIDRLTRIMAILRSPGGCPWDAEQTPETLKSYIVEEAYEVLEAIDRGDPVLICDELGDLLLQVVFQARIFEERSDFDFADVATALADKLERRHPHVFDDAEAGDRAALSAQWEQIKAAEKAQRSEATSALAGIPDALPALMRAHKVGERAKRAGLDAPQAEDAFATVHRQLADFEHALRAGDPRGLEDGLGDILFAVVNLGRLAEIDAEEALRAALARFTRHFNRLEAELADEGRTLRELSPREMTRRWKTGRDEPAPETGCDPKT